MIQPRRAVLRSGALVGLRIGRWVRLVRVVAYPLPPSPKGAHDGSPRHLLGRRYRPKLRRWQPARIYHVSDVVRVHPKGGCVYGRQLYARVDSL